MSILSNIISICIIALGVILAWYFTQRVLVPKVFQPLCITDTEECINVEYWRLRKKQTDGPWTFNTPENAVLVHSIDTDYWFWFNGQRIYAYGFHEGYDCVDDGYEPNYIIDAAENKVIGFECIAPLSQVKEAFIADPLTEHRHIFIRDLEKGYDIYTLLATMIERGIITYPTP